MATTLTRKRWAIIASLSAIAALAVLIGWRTAVGQARAAVMQADPDTLLTDAALRARVIADGRPVFVQNCASCHGADGAGSREAGVPDMRDAEVLHGGGLVSEFEQIVLHGIRSGDTRGRNLADMPAYGRATPYTRDRIEPLRPAEIDDLATFLSAAQGRRQDRAAVARGKALYQAKACYDCHVGDASGDPAIGAPNLIDGVWLHGDGSKAAMRHTIANGLAGISPAFKHHLTPYEARVAATYAASLADRSGNVK
jgi:cytochrome c oxidase cbb3-type subunit 3